MVKHWVVEAAGIVSGKGNPEGIKLGAIGSKLKEVWDEKIMNGEFWAGAWQTFLNVGGKIMTDAWQAVNSMASLLWVKRRTSSGDVDGEV